MTSETLFVWNYLPGQPTPVVAGRLDISKTPAGDTGTFVYGRSYLERGDRVALDPVCLPLTAGPRSFTTLCGFPGVLLDACPDKWGIKIIDRLFGKKNYPSGYLLANDPGHAGSLAFSRAADGVPVELSSRQFPLQQLLEAAEDIEQNREVDPELLKALHPGTGGARPKCNINDDQGIWIAKFSSINDDPRISIPRLEHATMRLGEVCGIRTAQTRIESIGDKDVCLVKRFDRTLRDGQLLRTGYLSARTIFFADQAFAISSGTGSYGRIATWMTRYGCNADDRHELYRRMVFNCAVRNSDDHELNHGLLHVADNQYRLADAFDVVPVLQTHQIHHHALLIGDSAAGTVANLVNNASAFGLDREEAMAIIAKVQGNIREHWQEACYEAGFDDVQIHRLTTCFKPLPLDEPKRAPSVPGSTFEI